MAKYVLLPTTPPPPVLPPHSDFPFSLYAGDLHPDVTESELYILFSMIGPLRNVHICRDRLSCKSLCYAYINFCFPSHAADALSRLNHTELRGKPIRIMWCQRDPILRKTGIANLFVKNLDSTVHDARLEEVFGKFGRILSCKIAKDDSGKSKGFGFVQFDSEQSAIDALCALNGFMLDGKTITVAKFLKKSERKEPEFTNVYVKNLDEDFTETSLKEKFLEYGKVTSAVIMRDAEGKSRRFGFVNFESHDKAKIAIEALNGAVIGSKIWFVGKAMKKAERDVFLQRASQKQNPNASNLFVRNLATDVNEKDLREVFGAFGRITFAKVICYKNGVSKGIGYVCFSKPEEAKKAMVFLNGFCYHGKYMYVSVALSKEECAKRLQALLALQYSAPSVTRFPFYNINWQPNLYQNADVFHAFKPQNYQSRVGVVRCALQTVANTEKTEIQVQKEDVANDAGLWDGDHGGLANDAGDHGGLALQDKSPTNSEWDT